MRSITVFNFLTLNGFYKGIHEDISWHNKNSQEESEFASDAAQSPKQNILLLGRVTYEMMVSYWPTEMAKKNAPRVADGMNRAPKLVFSNSLKEVSWHNTSIIKGDIIEEVKKLKSQPGADMTILGSGSIIRQFAEHNLIDHYTFMIDPVVLGAGATVFGGLPEKLELQLVDSKAFKSGTLLVNYKAVN